MLWPVEYIIRRITVFSQALILPFVRRTRHVLGVAGELNGKFWYPSLVDESNECEVLLMVSINSGFNLRQLLTLKYRPRPVPERQLDSMYSPILEEEYVFPNKRPQSSTRVAGRLCSTQSVAHNCLA